MNQTVVLKFGGASVETPGHFERVVSIIAIKKKSYSRVVVVVSAMGDATDRLLGLALEVNPTPPKRELDMLLSVGERVSISLLAMALAKEKIAAKSFTGSQSGIITTADHFDARIVEMRPKRLEACLDEGSVAIVAGFQGVSRSNEITTLGRGGSDTSAVALAIALNADVEFFKDVGGIFSADPKIDGQAKLIEELTYDEALAIQGKILSKRCLELAKRNALPLKISSFLSVDAAGSLVRDPSLKREATPLYEEEFASLTS